jgi:hypothetical protein
VWLLLAVLVVVPCTLAAQSALDYIEHNRNFSASNYCIYPDTGLTALTPPPAGKHAFYISHYGRHGSRYLSNRKCYEMPYLTLAKADSLGKLTTLGQDVMNELRAIIDDSEDRWGDLTGIGKKQHREIAQRMMANFPEVFSGNAFIDARSTIVSRCILSMGSAVLKMASVNPGMQVTMNASFHDMWYLNYQDKLLRDSMMNYRAKVAYDEFCKTRIDNPRLMQLLFTDTAYVHREVDENWLNYYLLKTALIQQNTSFILNHVNFLIDLFTYEDIHRFWQRENAWWYITYGPSPLTGSLQPLTQRYLLRKMMTEADSIIALDKRGASLRYGHETVVLPLVCLLGLNGYDFRTENLEELESKGWWACQVFPMASNLQIVFYRKDAQDQDVLIKVLLNEKEATLPLPSDIAPYYHWSDFRKYYLEKLERGESALRLERQRVHSHLLDHGEQTIGAGW